MKDDLKEYIYSAIFILILTITLYLINIKFNIQFPILPFIIGVLSYSLLLFIWSIVDIHKENKKRSVE